MSRRRRSLLAAPSHPDPPATFRIDLPRTAWIPEQGQRLGANRSALVLALYARGMSTRDIQGHLRELYGTEVSADLISRVTDAVLDELRLWQSRPLDRVYPIIYIDALFVSVREAGAVVKKAVYVALAVNMEGARDVLGFWIEASEGARFWLS
ncbi:MAG TPA: transposase, partial [Polyangiales bacterium]